MQIVTDSETLDRLLAQIQGDAVDLEWELVIGGFWSASPYHSGYRTYYVARDREGRWLLKSVARNAELDGVTEEDVEAGRLNDDQLQAIWNTSLEEAQAFSYESLVSVMFNAPSGLESASAARYLYDAAIEADSPAIDEVYERGLLKSS